MEFVLFIILIVIALCFPRFTHVATLLIFAPLCGFFCGTFAWGIFAMFDNELITLKMYGTFLVVATILSEFVCHHYEVGKC